MFFKIIVTIIFLLAKSNTCPIKTDQEYYALIDFSNFKDLNFTDCFIPFQNVLTLEIRPNKQIILDDTLNMTGLKFASNNLYFGFIFTNIKGIDLNSTSLLLKQIKFDQNFEKGIHFNFILSNFQFYFRNELIDKKLCDQKYFYHSKIKDIGYWKSSFLLAEIKFLFLKKTVKFSEQTCPLVFNSLDIQLFAIEKLSCSFISKNMLGFYDIQPNNSLKFKKPLIFQFSAKLYHVDLKQTFLNEMIFEKLIVLDLYGQVNSIQNDLFKKLYSLKMIRFHTQNAKSLLTNNNKWLKYLNNKIYLDPIDIEYMLLNDDKMFILSILQTFSDLTFYDYPEEDFCYFKNFPHKNFVLVN